MRVLSFPKRARALPGEYPGDDERFEALKKLFMEEASALSWELRLNIWEFYYPSGDDRDAQYYTVIENLQNILFFKIGHVESLKDPLSQEEWLLFEGVFEEISSSLSLQSLTEMARYLLEKQRIKP